MIEFKFAVEPTSRLFVFMNTFEIKSDLKACEMDNRFAVADTTMFYIIEIV